MTLLAENKELAVMTIILLLLSILCRFITGIFLNSLIRETENMSVTENRLLKQCKTKFRNCYKLNDGVPNIPVFVDKFVGRIQIGRLRVDSLGHLSGQLMLLSIAAAGLGACRGLAQGGTIGEIIPFYLMSFLGLYVYFSVSGMVDLDGKKEMLKISLTDFLENHMAPRLSVLEESELAAQGQSRDDGAVKGEGLAARARSVTGNGAVKEAGTADQGLRAAFAMKTLESGRSTADSGKSSVEKSTEEQVFTKKQEKELEELLKEFFA